MMVVTLFHENLSSSRFSFIYTYSIVRTIVGQRCKEGTLLQEFLIRFCLFFAVYPRVVTCAPSLQNQYSSWFSLGKSNWKPAQ